MSVIQKIRDKYARLAVILIALALLGFILTDYLTGRGRNLFSSGSSSTVGRVNGKKIGLADFEAKLTQIEEQQKNSPYYQGGEAARQQNIQGLWDQEVNRIVMEDEMNKLGIAVGKRELNDILFGANPPEDIKKAGTDPQTQQFSPVLAQQAINDMRKKATREQLDQFNTYLASLKFQRQNEKFMALLSNSSNFPRWYVEKTNADNSQMAKISMVKQEFSSIIDTTIKISDQEIQDFINKHKEDYKQEETRSISYVSFSALPSAADSNNIRTTLLNLKPAFDTATDMEHFYASQGMSDNNFKGYLTGRNIQHANKDSIFKLPVGRVYGPYLDGGTYVLAKLLGAKQMPDSAKVRHILIATSNRDQQGNFTPTRDTAEALKIMDTVKMLLAKGVPFDSVCKKYSEDPGSKDKGGVYEKIEANGGWVYEFSDFALGNPVGTKGVVKTDFGYHYMEVLKQYGGSMAYKVSYYAVPITASTQTDQDASNQANLFAGDSRDIKSFDLNYDKNLKPRNINKLVATDIKPADYAVPGLGNSRNFVREVYKASLGEVLQPEKIEDAYVVAVVTEINKKGTQTVAKARNMVEPLLRNKKKGEILKQRVGNVTTLEAAAAALNKPIEVVDSVRMKEKPKAMPVYEGKVNGAAFNPNNRGKVVPEALIGGNGVYVIRVDEVSATALANADVAANRKQLYEQAKNSQAGYVVMNALKDAANVVDKRSSIPQF